MSKVASNFNLECLARKRLPGVVFDTIHGGSGQQSTVRRNLRSLAEREAKASMIAAAARVPPAIGPARLAGPTRA